MHEKRKLIAAMEKGGLNKYQKDFALELYALRGLMTAIIYVNRIMLDNMRGA